MAPHFHNFHILTDSLEQAVKGRSLAVAISFSDRCEVTFNMSPFNRKNLAPPKKEEEKKWVPHQKN